VIISQALRPAPSTGRVEVPCERQNDLAGGRCRPPARPVAAQADGSQSFELTVEKESLAASVRDKGYACDRVEDMERVDRFDNHIRAGWVVRCGTAASGHLHRGPGFEVTPLTP